MKILKVGGCVRDELLGITPKDYDYVVLGRTVQGMLDEGFEQVGSTTPVFIHKKLKGEYSLPRREVSTGPGHNDFTYQIGDVSLTDDLRRRDFTVNAMAMTVNGSVIIDPFKGCEDLDNMVLRCVDPITFSEDPLRCMRAARFAARLGFDIEDKTLTLCKGLATALRHLSAERIYGELKKGIVYGSSYFEWLDKVGALRYILPELYESQFVPQPKEHHHEVYVWNHLMMCLDNAVKRVNMTVPNLFAVLFHDIGKTATPSKDWPSHHGHDGDYGVEVMLRIAGRLKMDTTTTHLCTTAVEHHMKFHKLNEMRPGSIVRLLRKLGLPHRWDVFDNFLQVGYSDCRGRVPVTVPDNWKWIKIGRWFEKFRVPKGVGREVAMQMQVEGLKELLSEVH